ncbi:hypothetical protein P7C70_g1734, partial [Phenoliferia sp. Uapishka_3]
MSFLHPTTSRTAQSKTSSRLTSRPSLSHSKLSAPGHVHAAAHRQSLDLLPAHGLTLPLPPLDSLPPLPATSTRIHLITAAQYATLHTEHARVQLPNEQLFPWLHAGADVPGSQAAAYFGFTRGKAATLPSYRGLTTVQALSPLQTLPNSPSSASLSSSTCSSSSSHSSFSTPLPPTPHSVLVSSFPPSSILTPSSSHHRASFAIAPTYSNTAVNLRTFGGQPAKYASISDIVVYGEDGLDQHGWDGVSERVKAVLQGVVEAVEAERERRKRAGIPSVEYRVFLVSDSFKTFECDYPHLISTSSSGFLLNKLDFFARERDEMRVLTQSSEIGPGVFLGNTQDVPSGPLNATSDSTSSISTMMDDGNPSSYAICIEAHDQGSMPDSALLREVEDILNGFEDDQLALLDFGAVSLSDSSSLHPSKGDSVDSPIMESPSNVLHIPSSQIAHIESLSTPTGLPSSHLTSYVTRLVSLAFFIHAQSSPAPSSRTLPRRVLIHCGDGYTETSILGLAYIMVSQQCTLPEAYIFLQEECGRSFFVYPGEVEVLLKVEKRIVELRRREERAGGQGMERSDSGFAEDEEKGSPKRKQDRRSADAEVSEPAKAPWFFAETFDGHFPSRILSFLYLGNLNHASNALMLKQLGITHVVSMGESALTPPRQPPFSLTSPFSRSPLPTNSLWLEERLGNISVLDVTDIADDGIAGIRRTFDQTLEFIEEARRQGGKVLVHCRVGVSRSATVVIAYLMRELELDLKSAYLLTRSRRLNILIQPNLPFAATLHAYEAELLEARDAKRSSEGRDPRDDDPVEELALAGLKWSNRLDWSFFANEIAVLNERFLSCGLATQEYGPRYLRFLVKPTYSLAIILTTIISYLVYPLLISSQSPLAAVLPTTNPFAAFLLLSYPVTPPFSANSSAGGAGSSYAIDDVNATLPLGVGGGAAGGAGEGQYGKGLNDLLFLAFYVVVHSFVRHALMRGPLRQVAKWVGVRKGGKTARFVQESYSVVYFTASGLLGLKVMSQQKSWWFQTEHFWTDYPQATLSASLKAYYLLQFAYWGRVPPNDEADDIKDLREKYGSKLSTAKELFPDWTDEDLLSTIQEAAGDLDVAIVRITDGQAEQWGSVKVKKVKKEAPAVATTPVFAGRGGFGDRGGRGRGALAAGRGGRGVPRGGRGGAVPSATPRAPYTNGSASNGTTPASFAAPAPTPAAPTWVTPAAAPASTTPAPTGWGDVAAQSTTAAAATSEWGAPTETSTTATQGWGDEPTKATNGDAVHEEVTPEAQAPVVEAPKAKPASKIIAPGAKMSWAQIARPASPPKPTPPPPAPVAAPPSPPVVSPEPSPPTPEPVVEETPAPEPEVEAEAAAPTPTSASWNEAPAPGPLDAWGSTPGSSTPAPLGVGEGWADAVAAAPEPDASYAHQIAPEVEAHLPPNDVATAGPIEVSAPAVVEESVQTIPVAPEPVVEAPQEKLFGAGPPGLSKRASNRPQQEGVVMPSERAAAGLDIGVQFGSLNLFENQPSFQQEAPVQQQAAPKQPEQSFAQEAPAPPQQQYSHEAAQHQYQQAQQAQAQQQQQHHQLQEQGVQTSFSQPPPNSFAPGNAFSNRYPSSQYGQPQQVEEQHSLGSQSPYAPFKPDTASSPYFQHPGSQHSHSPAPLAPGQSQQGVPSSYNSFNSLPQQAPGGPAAFGASQSDYSALYGQDALRNMVRRN